MESTARLRVAAAYYWWIVARLIGIAASVILWVILGALLEVSA